MESNPALDKLSIEKALASGRQSETCNVFVFDSLESTNQFLLEHPAEIGQAQLCVTEDQTAGRGRRGNVWKSAANKNITMSLGWRFSEWPDGLSALSLAAGMVIAEELNSTLGLNVGVKWPNDLMVDDCKLGGILIELAGQASGSCYVVIGLGLNVHQPDWSGTTPQNSRKISENAVHNYAWQDLKSLGKTLDRNKFIGNLATALIEMLKAFQQKGFAPLVTAWNQYSVHANKDILVLDGEKEIAGKMLGVDHEGALLILDRAGENHRFTNSNVSIRPLAERD